jgi:hypothetical protein
MKAFQYSPFATLALKYRNRGFSPIPITAGSKVPGYRGKFLEGWTRYYDEPMTPETIRGIALMDPYAGLGLALGYRDVVGIDVDDLRAYPAMREIMGGLNAPAKRGMKGACAFFRGPGIAPKKFIAKPERDQATGKIRRPTLVEILGYGNQTVIPPTLHPDLGQPYRWLRASLEDIQSIDDLPLFRSEWIPQLGEALAPFMPEIREIPEVREIQPKAIELTESTRKRYQGYADCAFQREVSDLGHIAKGGRMLALRRTVCVLGKWVHHGFLKKGELTSALRKACTDNALIKEHYWGDLMKTIEWALGVSANDPLPELKERTRA